MAGRKFSLNNVLEIKRLADYFERLPDISARALSMSMNRVGAGTGLNMFRATMYSEVNFPSGYINKDRLSVTKMARPDDLSLKVTGRDDATSLARFMTGKTKSGLKVKVAKNGGAELKGAFLVNLRNNNRGLAVRVSKGQTALRNSTGAKPLTRGRTSPSESRVFLLYAPSVDQVFRGVAYDKGDEYLTMMETEFFRQFKRLANDE